MNQIVGQLNPQDRHVSIWGAGISGLILAYYLKKSGYRITIYEKSDRIGGKIGTISTPFGLVEHAANALFLNSDGLEFIRELKLEPIVATKRLKRLIFKENAPLSPFNIKLLLKVATGLKKKPPLITDGLSVADFFLPILDQEYINNTLSPALGGLYAISAEQLHFKSVFPHVGKISQFKSYWEFFKHIKAQKSTFQKTDPQGSVTFEGGMQGLINRLADILQKDVILNYQGPFKFTGNTVICTDAPSAAKLIEENFPLLAGELRKINYQKLTTSTVFYKRDIKSLRKAFGVLIPKAEKLHSIGILNNKAIFPANYPNAIPYTFISLNELSDEELHSDILRINRHHNYEDVEHIERKHWPKGLPMYDIKRFLAIKKLHELSKEHKQLAFFGNYVAGISLREMITAAKNFAAANKVI